MDQWHEMVWDIIKIFKGYKKAWFFDFVVFHAPLLVSKRRFQKRIQNPVKYLRWSFLQIFFKRPYLRCLTNFWIRLCNLAMLITFRGDWTAFLMWTLWPSHHFWNLIKLSPPNITSSQYGNVRKNIVNMLQWDILTLNKQ